MAQINNLVSEWQVMWVAVGLPVDEWTMWTILRGRGVKTVTALVGTLKAILCSLHNDANRHVLPPRREVSYFLTKKELS